MLRSLVLPQNVEQDTHQYGRPPERSVGPPVRFLPCRANPTSPQKKRLTWTPEPVIAHSTAMGLSTTIPANLETSLQQQAPLLMCINLATSTSTTNQHLSPSLTSPQTPEFRHNRLLNPSQSPPRLLSLQESRRLCESNMLQSPASTMKHNRTSHRVVTSLPHTYTDSERREFSPAGILLSRSKCLGTRDGECIVLRDRMMGMVSVDRFIDRAQSFIDS